MTSRAARRDRSLRVVAALAALLFAVVAYLLFALPAAEPVKAPADRLTASAPSALALYNLRAAAVMDYAGAPGAGLQIAVSTARLSPATRNALFARRIPVPNVKGAPFEWAAAPGESLHVRFGNQRQDAVAGILFEPVPGGDKPQLRIRAIDTNLTAEISGASSAQAKFGEVSFADPATPGAPMQVEVPTGETLTLTFDSAEAMQRARLIPGETLDRGRTPALSVGRVEIGQPSAANSLPRLTSVAEQLCGADRGKLLLRRSAPVPWDCRLARDEGHDRLAATEFTLAPGSVGVTLRGYAFSGLGGGPSLDGAWSRLAGNPAIAAVLAVLAGAVVWPVWRLRKRGILHG
jgi:hypothetical protein